MRSFLIVVVTALVAGLGLGSAVGYWRVAGYRELVDEYFGPRPFDYDSRFPDLPAEGEALPRAVVETDQYDFGTVEDGVTLRHDFAISNQGTGVLELRTGETSCRCTISGLDAERVEPGQTTHVTLEWTVEGKNERFAQSAVILTNDPHRRVLRFRVQGQRQRTLLLQPDSLSFSKATDETIRLESRLLTDLAEPIEIAQVVILDDATAEFFEVETTPLSGEQLAGGLARQGFAVKVRIKPGLSIGPVQQTIRLVTNQPELSPVELPLFGTIESGLSIVGRDWDSRARALRMGVVKSAAGAETRLVFSVRGALREGLELKVSPRSTDEVDVNIGPWGEIAEGRVRQVTVTVAVPPGSAAANHLGGQQGPLAEIVIETNQAEMPEIRIPVQFAVEN